MNDLFEHILPMKALSLWQPWASLVAAHVKLHETRHWATNYRGPLAIHAARTVDVAGAPDALCASVFGLTWRDTLPRGAFVSVGYLSAVVPAVSVVDDLTEADHAAGNFGPGRFALRIDNVRTLKTPIPARGRQGLFDWTPPENLPALLRETRDHHEACNAIRWGRSTPAVAA